jgi:tripeptide aminopeptidase
VLKDGVIRSSGDTILGADDKAGIAEMLETLRIAPVRPPIEIAISRQEEVGLLGVKNLDFSQISARRGFLLDNDTLDTIITGGPSYFAIDVTVTGRSAHAGMEPEKGINAIQAASRAIGALTLGRLDAETTANVGIINGGMIRNGVPATCTFAAEVPQPDPRQGTGLLTMVHIIGASGGFGAEVTVDVNAMCRRLPSPTMPGRCASAAGAVAAGVTKPALMALHRRVDLHQRIHLDGGGRHRRQAGALARRAHPRRRHGARGGDDGGDLRLSA